MEKEERNREKDKKEVGVAESKRERMRGNLKEEERTTHQNKQKASQKIDSEREEGVTDVCNTTPPAISVVMILADIHVDSFIISQPARITTKKKTRQD